MLSADFTLILLMKLCFCSKVLPDESEVGQLNGSTSTGTI